uniref:Uncharacterized protein n=1 Tax=Chromera velia CCMP2878 TaxID=1169474 RepID=A0A0G4FE20_9ALVE|eukprot:Cvel_3238.t1-p1 / transcript=Cvel_3238.t1 / gene=Cvel_3238 / organism=Chromera_velia_CCMP2878 / gene_product=hypothetical protein / transcript_product=hypothetical protein / location=Cvel_scaffold127:16408-18193(+) / protein_length=472 / sequence_SO=supercontig / SO=protein_coding / is_pseudo=false
MNRVQSTITTAISPWEILTFRGDFILFSDTWSQHQLEGVLFPPAYSLEVGIHGIKLIPSKASERIYLRTTEPPPALDLLFEDISAMAISIEREDFHSGCVGWAVRIVSRNGMVYVLKCIEEDSFHPELRRAAAQIFCSKVWPVMEERWRQQAHLIHLRAFSTFSIQSDTLLEERTTAHRRAHNILTGDVCFYDFWGKETFRQNKYDFVSALFYKAGIPAGLTLSRLDQCRNGWPWVIFAGEEAVWRRFEEGGLPMRARLDLRSGGDLLQRRTCPRARRLTETVGRNPTETWIRLRDQRERLDQRVRDQRERVERVLLAARIEGLQRFLIGRLFGAQSTRVPSDELEESDGRSGDAEPVSDPVSEPGLSMSGQGGECARVAEGGRDSSDTASQTDYRENGSPIEQHQLETAGEIAQPEEAQAPPRSRPTRGKEGSASCCVPLRAAAFWCGFRRGSVQIVGDDEGVVQRLDEGE